MKNKNNNQNEFERLGGQKSGGGGYIPPLDPQLMASYSNNTDDKRCHIGVVNCAKRTNELC